MAFEPVSRETYDIVEFSVDIDGKDVICWISYEALADNFGANRKTEVEVLKANLDKITLVAKKVIARTPSGARIVIKTADF